MAYYYNQQQDYYPSDRDAIQAQVFEKLFIGLIGAVLITVFTIIIGLPIYVLLIAVVAELVAIIGYFFARNEATIEKLYYTFVLSSAVLLGFTLQMVVAVVSNGFNIIIYTTGVTALIVGYTYDKAANTQVDLVQMSRKIRPFAFAFIGLILIGFFISSGYGIFELIISVFGAGLFSWYLYFDFNRALQEGYSSPARMAWDLYWDILLIFKYILRILLMLLGSRD